MTAPDDLLPAGSSHEFGGDWTTQKLEVLRKYLEAYVRVLKDKPSPQRPFRIAYIDAFAGTGSRRSRRKERPVLGAVSLPEFADDAPERTLKGSAHLALEIKPPFHRYIFVEQNRRRCESLRRLADDVPALSNRIVVKHGDANQIIRDMCVQSWRSHRAVLFLDPYGMQVDWATIEAVASTKGIDMWLLFPVGIGVNRMLARHGTIPPKWKLCLDRCLGTTDWYDAFYRKISEPTLFGDDDRRVKEPIDVIGRFFVKRLKTVFPAVVEQPAVLRNSRGSPLYLLCFAAANKKGGTTAKKIATDLLEGMR